MTKATRFQYQSTCNLQTQNLNKLVTRLFGGQKRLRQIKTELLNLTGNELQFKLIDSLTDRFDKKMLLEVLIFLVVYGEAIGSNVKAMERKIHEQNQRTRMYIKQIDNVQKETDYWKLKYENAIFKLKELNVAVENDISLKALNEKIQEVLNQNKKNDEFLEDYINQEIEAETQIIEEYNNSERKLLTEALEMAH